MTIQHHTKPLAEYIDSVLKDSAYGWWDWYIPTNNVVCNDLKLAWIGYEPKDFLGKGYEAYTGLVHPEDYERCMMAMRLHLTGEASIYRVDYRILASDGQYRWYLDRGVITERDAEGAPLRLRGIVIDMGNILVPQDFDTQLLEVVREALPLTAGTQDMFSICSSCKRIKVRDHAWLDVQASIDTVSRILESEVSHAICPDCIRTLYPEIADEVLSSSEHEY